MDKTPRAPEHGEPAPVAGLRLADALFTRTQQEVLALLFGQPGERFHASYIYRRVARGRGAVHRVLAAFEASGLVVSRRVGNEKLYQAAPDCPIFGEVRGIVLKTVGLAEALGAVLRPHARRVAVAFMHGPVVDGSEGGIGIEVTVIARQAEYHELSDALNGAADRIDRDVWLNYYRLAEWRAKVRRRDGWVRGIVAQPRIFLVGHEEALAWASDEVNAA